MDRVEFFLPFWWDSVYPDFDEWNDTWTGGFEHHQYLWELDDVTPFDGLLFSRENIKKNQKTQQAITDAGGVREYLELPEDTPLFGDIGAFGYRTEDEPPYDPLESLDFFDDMGYDRVCTVDHLITSKNQDDKQKRWDITVDNALTMRDGYRSGSYDFDLYGVVQGWDPDSYFQGVEELIDAGFQNIALGGLVRSRNEDLLDILQRCYPLWAGTDVNVHLFGLARWDLFPAIQKLEIDSIDNAYHRQAWLSKTGNYEFGASDEYTAVRIPLSHPHSKERIDTEQAVFDALQGYVDGEVDAETVFNRLETYEAEYCELKDKDRDITDYRDEYLRTLRERPWTDCECSVCQEYGAHVAIFRCNERNMRRGYHNLVHFYDSLKAYFRGDIPLPEKADNLGDPRMVDTIEPEDLDGDVLVITSCTKKKRAQTPDTVMEARDLYTGRLFKKVRELAEGHGWDYRVISAKYGWLHPEDEVPGYNERLETKGQALELRPKVIPELAAEVQNYDHFVVLAGKHYREVIEPLMDHRYRVLQAPKGYASLCSKVDDAIPARNAQLTEF